MPKELRVLIETKQPQTIGFYNGRPGASGVTRAELTPKELGDRLGFKFSERVHGGPGSHNIAPLESPSQLFEDVALVDLGPPFGVCAIAEKDIRRGKQLGLYTGVLSSGSPPPNNFYAYSITRENVPELTVDSHVSAEKIGGRSRFLAHFPRNCDDIIFADSGLKETVALANVVCLSQSMHGVPVVAMFAGEKGIKKGQMMGYDYAPEYWLAQNQTPDLMSKGGELIPRSAYKREGEVTVSSDSKSGQGRGSACLVGSGAPAASLPREVQHQVRACRASMFATSPEASIQCAGGGGSRAGRVQPPM